MLVLIRTTTNHLPIGNVNAKIGKRWFGNLLTNIYLSYSTVWKALPLFFLNCLWPYKTQCHRHSSTKHTITTFLITETLSTFKKVIFGLSRHSKYPLESACSAMCFNIIQLCVSGWLRSMSAVRDRNAAHSRRSYVRANRGCHATDGVAACRPDWQARLAEWCACCTLIPRIMGHSNSDEHKAITLSEGDTSVCMFAYLHASARVYWGKAFSVGLPPVSEQRSMP